MADHHHLPGLENLKQPLSLSDIDPNIEFVNNFSGINPIHQQPSGLNIQNPMGFSLDNLLSHLPESSGYSENFPGFFIHEDSTLPQQTISNDSDRVHKKRKATEIYTSGNTPVNSSPRGSDNGIARKNGIGRGKKAKDTGKNEAKATEIVHVRAKRGQATDSHSLAERVRREKINERLRCLQEIVPGCYKTMGMAVMLDEIINYVQSLQNQVEFLSMKLTAASTFYDFNADTDALETMQRAKAIEALKIQNGVSHGLPPAQFAPLGLNFEHYPKFPQTDENDSKTLTPFSQFNLYY